MCAQVCACASEGERWVLGGSAPPLTCIILEEPVDPLAEGCLCTLGLPGEGTGLTFTWRTEYTTSHLLDGEHIPGVMPPTSRNTR